MEILLELLHKFKLLGLGGKSLHVVNGFEVYVLSPFHVLKRLLITSLRLRRGFETTSRKIEATAKIRLQIIRPDN